MFYQNDFVFSTPARLQTFMLSLSDQRLDSLRSLTFIYEDRLLSCSRGVELTKNQRLEGELRIDTTFLLVRRLKGLQKLHVLLRARYMDSTGYWQANRAKFIDDLDPSRLQGMKTLFTVRGVVDVRVRDLDLEDNERDRKAKADKQQVLSVRKEWRRRRCDELVGQQKAALRHLNRGLQLAQTGRVVHDLYTKTNWRDDNTWPVLEGSDCGLNKGCSCILFGGQEAIGGEPCLG
jgi:hypothetical protein